MTSPVPDVRLVQNLYFPKYDVPLDWRLLINGTLDDTRALATAVIVALGTNALASDTEVLPDPDSDDRQGWWGDLDAEDIWNGWPIGSKLWLLRRAKILPPNAKEGSTVQRVVDYCRQALQPLVDRRVCSSFTVTAERVDLESVMSYITIFRGPLPAISLQYQISWTELIETAGW